MIDSTKQSPNSDVESSTQSHQNGDKPQRSQKPIKVLRENLGLIKDQGVGVPKYDLSTVSPGIFHFGVGNFHRAHFGYYLNELFNKLPEETKWGLVGSSARPDPTASKKEKLAGQDFLQTLVMREGDEAIPRILGYMVDYVAIQDEKDTSPVVNALLKPEIKIVSMTVTEGGYYLNPHTGKFDSSKSDIQKDIKNIDNPTSAFGMIVQALRLRRQKGMPPFTVMSCDNVPHNGDVCREVVVGVAKHVDSDLAKWIDQNVAFPNSMVDRIAIKTTERERAIVKNDYNLDDIKPVFCEEFTQWVIEDKFCQGRPKLEEVGVTFTDYVTPFETMKLRILNGGHAGLCYAAAVLGIQYVHEAMDHPVIGPYLDALETTEIVPSVGEVPGMDLVEYWGTIKERFANPAMHDTIVRNVAQGSDRQTKFIIPIIKVNEEEKRGIKGLALVSALWCRFCQGKTEAGEEIKTKDSMWDELHEAAMKSIDDPSAWLNMKDIYGEVIIPEFKKHFTEALKTINDDGVEVALKKYTEEAITGSSGLN